MAMEYSMKQVFRFGVVAHPAADERWENDCYEKVKKGAECPLGEEFLAGCTRIRTRDIRSQGRALQL
jgi:hypothetical protein